MTNPILTLDEAADHLGMTSDELMLSFYRGLPPGNMAFKEEPGGPLVWKRADLLPAPQKMKAMADMIETIAENTLQCIDCGFQAKSKGGLTTHRKKHGA